MKNKKKIFPISIGIVILFTLLYAVKLYNKPHVNVKTTKASYRTSATNLLNDFSQDEDAADKKYANQIIQVNGTVSEITNENKKSIIILKSPKSDATVMCYFNTNQDLTVSQGQKVSIKGICTGYLMDVILIDCTLINN